MDTGQTATAAASGGGSISGGLVGAPPPIPQATSSSQVTSSSPVPQQGGCPTGTRWDGSDCVPIGPPPIPGACPPNTPAGPSNCCPTGTVYRTDTQMCEAPDARSNAGQETCVGPQPACPPGQGVWCDFDDATFKCAPDGSSGVGGVGGGGGGRRSLAGLSSEELEMYKAITELARLLQGQGESLFNVGFPAYSEAINYYRVLLGKGGRAAAQAAVAPSAEGIAQGYEGARSAIGSGYLRGGAKEAALAETYRSQAGDTARLVQGVQPMAANALVSGGIAGAQAGQQGETAAAGAYGGLLSTQVQNRQFETSLKEQIRQFDVSIATQVDLANKARAAGLQAAAMQADLARQQLEEQKRQFEAQLAFQQQQSRIQQNQFTSQQRTSTGLGIGGLLANVLTGGLSGKIFGSGSSGGSTNQKKK